MRDKKLEESLKALEAHKKFCESGENVEKIRGDLAKKIKECGFDNAILVAQCDEGITTIKLTNCCTTLVLGMLTRAQHMVLVD